MKLNFSLSKISLLICFVFFICVRGVYFKNDQKVGYKAASWDAFGYYMYLPSTFIYNDVKELKWVPKIDSTYHLTGGLFYQAIALKEKSYTNKYLSGVAIMQTPFFAAAHAYAKISGVPADGFTYPYQYALLFGGLFYVFLGLVLLRSILLRYLPENTVAITLLFLCFTSNLVQYAAIDGAMSHAYIFALHAFVFWQTIRWFEKPTIWRVFSVGLVIGLAVIARPTELVLIFIPLAWGIFNKESRKAQRSFLKTNAKQLVFALLGGFLGLLPQLLYWHYTTGDWVFNVGSKWFFFNPWFRVLFGKEIGWFVYTPIALAMVAGLFLMKGKVFKRALITFCLLNIWVVISWSDWKYGATYSTRALVQSYPFFAIPLALVIDRFMNGKKRIILAVSFVLLTCLNMYQIRVYNSGTNSNFSPLVGLFYGKK